MRRTSFMMTTFTMMTLLAACGDAGSDRNTDTAPADTEAIPIVTDNTPRAMPPSRDPARPAGSLGDPSQATQVGAAVSEFSITLDPDTIPAGEVTVTLNNRGERPHTIEVRSTTQGRWRSTPIPPGGAVGLSMPLLPGTYEVVSTDADYVARGMKATLVVR